MTERERFEAYHAKVHPHANRFKDSQGQYKKPITQSAWLAWKARAELKDAA